MKKNQKIKPEVQSWYKDRYQSVVVHRKIMGLIAMGSLGCTLMLAMVISQLIPLKTIEPYVLQIDSRTGFTQVVDPVTAQQLTANQAVNDFFIVQYIRSREGYNAQDLMHNVNIVRLMSENTRVYNDFMAAANPNNPQSPITRLGGGGTRSIRFKSITYIGPQTIQARVLISEKPDKMPPTEYHRIILLRFEYVKMNLTTEERYLNPLGFRVTEYQINEDVLQ